MSNNSPVAEKQTFLRDFLHGILRDIKIHKIYCPDAKGTVWEVRKIEDLTF